MPEPTHQLHSFMHAEQTGQLWLKTVADELGTEDQHYAYRALRAWLCTVRDRLTPDGAAHFAAQLPLLLRGVFFDGWVPSRVPVKYDTEQFLILLAQEARVPIAEARHAAAAVTAALATRCSPGQLDHLLAQLPVQLREVLRPVEVAVPAGAPAVAPPRSGPAAGTGEAPHLAEDVRIERLEQATQAAIDALHVLVEGLEELPTQEPHPGRISAAAKHAHQVLLEAWRRED